MASRTWDADGQRLRTIAGLLAVAAVLAGLGCGGGDSAASGEPNSPKPLAGAQSSPTRKPVVTKKYFEDLAGDQHYQYWDYTFDFGDRDYLARVYTDEPEVAYVDRIDAGSVDDDAGQMDGVEVDTTGKVGAVQRQDPVERRNLRKVLRYLVQDGWREIQIQTVVGEIGYKPLSLHQP